MKLINVKEIAKFADQNPDQPYSEIAAKGYVRHRVISNDRCSVTIACFRDGQTPVGLHRHPGASEIYYVIEGDALCTDSSGVERRMSPGNAVYFEPGELHNMHAALGSDLIYYRVQIGPDRKTERP